MYHEPPETTLELELKIVKEDLEETRLQIQKYEECMAVCSVCNKKHYDIVKDLEELENKIEEPSDYYAVMSSNSLKSRRIHRIFSLIEKKMVEEHTFTIKILKVEYPYISSFFKNRYNDHHEFWSEVKISKLINCGKDYYQVTFEIVYV